MTDTKPQTTTAVNGHIAMIGDAEPFWIMSQSPAPADTATQRAVDKALAARRGKITARKEAESVRFREKMAEPVMSEVPKQVKVRAGDVRFDPRYQTDERFDEQRAKWIAEEFDWQELDSIKLNIRPEDPSGVAWCYDGRHRTTAVILRLGADTLINATLINVRYQREAELFAEQDRLKKIVPERIKFRAKIEAGDTEALAQQAMLDRLGLTLGRRAAARTMALKAFLDCCRIKGLDATEAGLAFILDAWHGAGESFEESIAKGVIWFVANRRDDPNYRPERVREVLGRASIREIESAAGGKSERMTTNQRIAAVIVDLYNRQLREQRVIADWNPRKDR